MAKPTKDEVMDLVGKAIDQCMMPLLRVVDDKTILSDVLDSLSLAELELSIEELLELHFDIQIDLSHLDIGRSNLKTFKQLYERIFLETTNA